MLRALPILIELERCLATGRMGRECQRWEQGGFEVAEVVDDAGVVFDCGGFPSADDGEIEVVADAGILHVVLSQSFSVDGKDFLKPQRSRNLSYEARISL